MQYVGWYFGLGAIVIIAFAHMHKLARAKDSALIPLLGKPSRAEKYLLPLAGYSVLLLLWPLIVFWKIKEALFPENATLAQEAETFAVKPEHLLREIAIAEIEQDAMVVDPLGAVPNLPFGHLNAVWLKFKSSIGVDDEVWAFSADHTTSWGYLERLHGYVAVNDDRIGPYFLTVRMFEDQQAE